MDRRFSVLMSLYAKEHADYFKLCMDSVLEQTAVPSEIVMVIDGPISYELKSAVKEYRQQYPGLIKVVPLKVNMGLGIALAEGIKHCSYELVARMDTDDIARSDRFEIQLDEFEKDPELDICGSHIIEFEKNKDNISSVRKVPLTHGEIAKYQKRRSAFNHMTVMYKKAAVINAGNYQNVPLMEDDMMWVNMLQSGVKCKNIDDYLVYVRAGREMIERRGGWSYFLKYKNGRKQILKTGYIGRYDYFLTVCIQFVVALAPSKIRIFVFTKFLRNRYVSGDEKCCVGDNAAHSIIAGDCGPEVSHGHLLRGFRL